MACLRLQAIRLSLVPSEPSVFPCPLRVLTDRCKLFGAQSLMLSAKRKLIPVHKWDECYVNMKSDWKCLVNKAWDPRLFQCNLITVTSVSHPEPGKELGQCLLMVISASHASACNCQPCSCRRLTLNVKPEEAKLLCTAT